MACPIKRMQTLKYSRLLRNCENRGEVIVLIMDRKAAIFGGFFSGKGLQITPGFYGNGESFIFKINVLDPLIL